MDKTTESLGAAVQAVAEEARFDLGAHPSLDELAGHRAGELSAADDERIQDHLALCHMCTRLFLDLGSFPRLETPDGVEPACELEVAAAWRKMAPALLASAEPFSEQYGPGPHRRWRTFLAAAVLLVTVGAIWIGVLYRRLEERAGPQYARVIDVAASRGPRPYLVSPDAEQILLVVESFDLSAYSRGRLEITRKDVVLETADLDPSPDERSLLYLVLPRAQFPEGTYRLKIYGLDETGRHLLKDMRLTLEDSLTR